MLFRSADRVNIKVARVDIETSKIDFVLAGERLKKALVVEDDADSPNTTSPWAKGKPSGKGAATGQQTGKQKQGVTPTPAPLAVKEAPRQSKAETKADKKVITVSSSNPPTTPMLGLAEGAKARAKEADVQAARKQTAKGKAASIDQPAAAPPKTGKSRNQGALLSRKKK